MLARILTKSLPIILVPLAVPLIYFVAQIGGLPPESIGHFSVLLALAILVPGLISYFLIKFEADRWANLEREILTIGSSAPSVLNSAASPASSLESDLKSFSPQIAAAIEKCNLRLREYQEFQSFFNRASKNILVRFREDGLVDYAAGETSTVNGLVSASMLGKELSSFMDDKERTLFIDHLHRAKTGDLQNFEFDFIGQPYNCTLLYQSPSKNYFCLLENLSWHKQTEQALKENDSRLWELLRAIRSGIIIVNPESELIEFVNPSLESMFSTSATNFVGRPLVDFFADISFVKEHNLAGLISECLSGKHFTLTLSRADGKPLHLEISAGAVRLNAENKLVFNVHDISISRESERIRSQFSNMLTLELRRPLNSIKVFLELLGSGGYGITQQLSRRAVMQLDSINRLTSSIDELLEVAPLEVDEINLSHKEVNLADIFRASSLRIQSVAEAKGISVSINPTDLSVEADADRLVQVMQNLLSNAVKFSGNGASVAVSAVEEDGFVLVKVTDTGRGISKEFHESIFDRFFQVSPDDSKDHGGMGLGLALSKTIVEAHKGQIGVESTLGQGSTFWFRLPKRN